MKINTIYNFYDTILKNKKEIFNMFENKKQELLFIKEQLDDSTPKIDISNVYVWKTQHLYSIVKLEIKKIHGITFLGKEADGYQSTLIDIFSNNIIYQKNSIKPIQKEEYFSDNVLENTHHAFLLPLHEVDKNILAYANKKVPLYVLQQLYYKLNNVDINAYVLKKEKD